MTLTVENYNYERNNMKLKGDVNNVRKNQEGNKRIYRKKDLFGTC